MKLEIVNGMISFIGKPSEQHRAESAIKAIAEELEIEDLFWIDNGDEDEMDLGITYDMDVYSVDNCKDAWRRVKAA